MLLKLVLKPKIKFFSNFQVQILKIECPRSTFRAKSDSGILICLDFTTIFKFNSLAPEQISNLQAPVLPRTAFSVKILSESYIPAPKLQLFSFKRKASILSSGCQIDLIILKDHLKSYETFQRGNFVIKVWHLSEAFL